jgi:hypothetical protein
MTERDFRIFKRLMVIVPVFTLILSLGIQWGSWQANSANVQFQMRDQKCDFEKRFDKIEKEKANADLVESKFEAIDWKLDLIMKNLGVNYIKKSKKDTL